MQKELYWAAIFCAICCTQRVTADPLPPLNDKPAATAQAQGAVQRADAIAVVKAARARCAHQPPGARPACLRAAETTLRQAELYSSQP